MTEEGKEFGEVLKDAQKQGYAEADPTFDIEGIDSAHKLSILSSIAFSTVVLMDKIFVEGSYSSTSCFTACPFSIMKCRTCFI